MTGFIPCRAEHRLTAGIRRPTECAESVLTSKTLNPAKIVAPISRDGRRQIITTSPKLIESSSDIAGGVKKLTGSLGSTTYTIDGRGAGDFPDSRGVAKGHLLTNHGTCPPENREAKHADQHGSASSQSHIGYHPAV